MSKSQYLCASSAAVLLAALVNTTAFAQTRPSAPQTDVEEVVVTGSFIAGTPEDAAIPVEAVTLEELRNQGSPSNLDLVKNMSEVAGVAGEANRNNLFAVGAQSINLRGLGSSRTVVVFNGRRLPDQYSASVGRFNNIALIPNAAIGRVETLKDGGATTYGADAVGGVQNYITRRNLDGLETNANYRYIDDSKGDYDFDVSWGRVGDKWNAMVVAGYTHRSALKVSERDFALQPFFVNPAGYSGFGSPGAYTFQRGTGVAAAPFGTITPTGGGVVANRFGGDVQMGPTGVVRDPFCDELGGFSGFSATPSPLCYYQSNLNSNLVEETDTFQVYGEVNYEFNEYLKVHVEGLYYYLDVPNIPLDSFTNVPQTFPIDRNSPAGATQAVGTSAFVVPGANPAVRQLLNNIRNANGTLGFGDPSTPGTQAFQIVNGGRVGLNTGTWRPFGFGGNPVPELDEQHNYSDTFRFTVELSGDVPEVAGFKMKWSAAATFNYLLYHIDFQDILVDRLQNALSGLGGPSCTGTTPGANGCQFFNPFSSGIAQNVYSGVQNPGFVGTGTFTGYPAGQGLQNSAELIRSLYVPLELDRQGEYSIYDFLLSGESPFRLWAEDPIALAVGGQYRYFREEVDLSDLADRDLNPCATVTPPSGVIPTCVGRTGPLVNNRGSGVTGFTRDQDRRYPVYSTFFEVRAPIFDTLIASVSGRYEKFFSDVSTRNNEVFVPQAAAKWDVTDWLSFRGTIGETFSQVDPPAPLPSAPGGGVGFVSGSNISAPTEYGATAVQFSSANYSNLDVKPETGWNYNVGAIVQFGNFRANVDYFNIKIDDLIRAQTTAQLVRAVVLPGQLGAGALINCSSPLLTENQALLGGRPFVQLNGACVQGQSALNSTGVAGAPGGLANAAGQVTTSRLNFFGTQGAQTALVNGGTLKTSGIDMNAAMRFDEVFGGQLTLNADLTWVLKYDASDYVVAGIKVADGYDGIGFTNSTTGRNNQRIAEFVGSVGFNYRLGRHNFNWNTRFRDALKNDDTALFLEQNDRNLNIGSGGVVPTGAGCVDTNPQLPPIPAGVGTGQNGALVGTAIGFNACQNASLLSGQNIAAIVISDFSYSVTLPWETTMSVTIQNVFDEDPKFSREALGYDASIGTALGRTIRVGVRKRW